jgi:hypothetical protein
MNIRLDMADLRQIMDMTAQPSYIFYPAGEYTSVLIIDPVFDQPQPLLRLMKLLLQDRELLRFLHIIELINSAVNRQAVSLAFQHAYQTVDPQEESFDPFVVR